MCVKFQTYIKCNWSYEHERSDGANVDLDDKNMFVFKLSFYHRSPAWPIIFLTLIISVAFYIMDLKLHRQLDKNGLFMSENITL